MRIEDEAEASRTGYLQTPAVQSAIIDELRAALEEFEQLWAGLELTPADER